MTELTTKEIKYNGAGRGVGVVSHSRVLSEVLASSHAEDRAFSLSVLFFLIAIMVNGCETNPALAFTTEASYYTYTSCIKEGSSGICANGERMNDEALTTASWDFKFGTRLLITNLRNGRQVVVTVNDRGPSKRLYKVGRCLDLSKKAFESIENLKIGVVKISVEKI